MKNIKLTFLLILLSVNIYAGVVTDGMVNWFKLDENTGVLSYDTIVHSTISLLNGAGWTTGKCNYATTMTDGSNDYCGMKFANLPAYYSAVKSSMTVMCWVNLLLPSNQGYYTILDLSAPWILGIATAGDKNNPKLTILLSGTAPGGWYQGTVNISSGVWHQVGYTYDGATVRFINDGVFEATTIAVTGNIAADLVTYTFAFNHSGSSAKMSIDEVMIYNRALTAAEVLCNYQTCTAGTCEGGATLPPSRKRKTTQIIGIH